MESLADLNEQFIQHGGNGLLIFRGNPTDIFRKLINELQINRICYEQECEPIWRERDEKIEELCDELGVERIECISHTLWDPKIIIETNGGHPPLTYQMMLHTISCVGLPQRPVNSTVDFKNVKFGEISENLKSSLDFLEKFPQPEDLSIYPENTNSRAVLNWKGGERHALKQLETRVRIEQNAFEKGCYLPNQANIDLIGTSSSMSAAIKFGCLSVRRFYYAIHDKVKEVQMKYPFFPSGNHITGQLIWREYFYTMSVNNPNFGMMKNNPICIDIPWRDADEREINLWKEGKTGIPIIDAAMRQLLSEGWLHHTMRNITATFLTRTGLWINWEVGFQHFMKYLLDGDWSVSSGNWMWVASSAFESLLDSSKCAIIPLAMRLDPKGEYIKRYVPELSHVPIEYIHQPWLMSIDIQEKIECIIGQDYPEPMIDLDKAAQINSQKMKNIRDSLIETRPHIRPSNEDEIRLFFWMQDETQVY